MVLYQKNADISAALYLFFSAYRKVKSHLFTDNTTYFPRYSCGKL